MKNQEICIYLLHISRNKSFPSAWERGVLVSCNPDCLQVAEDCFETLIPLPPPPSDAITCVLHHL